ncbi:MAG: antitoxin family protein [Chloroflexota bacterium]|nr:antitoxin family protein [Chloroflexota bacterium]
MASQRVRARFEHGVFKPLEAVDLIERQEVTLAIQAETFDGVGPAEFVPNPNWGKQADGQDLIELLYEARRLGSREPPTP